MVGAPSLASQTMLTMGDDPSYRKRPAVHLPHSLLHSLAMGIARDKAMSTLKYSQTFTKEKGHSIGFISSRFVCHKPILFQPVSSSKSLTLVV